MCLSFTCFHPDVFRTVVGNQLSEKTIKLIIALNVLAHDGSHFAIVLCISYYFRIGAQCAHYVEIK